MDIAHETIWYLIWNATIREIYPFMELTTILNWQIHLISDLIYCHMLQSL
jgi:hypothetical protein